ncbi:ankyrin repeat domain-containing protein [Gammaproteobacteria bacterium]|nr:ankyrin repeat domain-containing protein [Gammaproteobacteria bacterium]
MFKRKQLYCCHTFLTSRSVKICRQLWSAMCIAAVLSWGSSVFSISILSAQTKDPRSELTELLFKAVKNNDIDAARAAVKAGAELSRINLNGETAMDIAINNNHFKIANYLVFARRIEQQVTRKLTPTFNSVQQASPEAAPEVEILTDRSSISQQTKKENILLPKKVKLKEPTTPIKLPIEKIRITAEESGNQDKDITKISQIKSRALKSETSNTRAKDQKNKHIKPNENTVEEELSSARLVFYLDADGKLMKSSATEIRRIQQTLRQKASRMLPDIERRKSLFIPKPRIKPSFSPPIVLRQTQPKPKKVPKLKRKINSIDLEFSANPMADVVEPLHPQKSKSGVMQLNNVNPRHQETNLSKKQSPKVKKPVNPKQVKTKTSQIDYIRPTRRISPELINKLRRGLEKTKHQQKISIEKTTNTGLQKINSPKFNQERQKRSLKTSPLPAPKTSPEEKTTIVPKLLLEDKTTSEESNSKEHNFFQQFYTNLTNFLGVTSDTQKAINKMDPPSNRAKTISLLRKLQTSGNNTAEIQKISPRAKNRPTTQLSLPIEPLEHEQTNLKSKNLEKIMAKNNPWPNQFIPTSPKVVKRQPNEKELRQRELNASPRSKAVINFVKKGKQSSYLKTKKMVNNIHVQQPSVSMPLTRLRKPLKNILLTMGNSMTTGQSKLPHGIAEPDPCIEKRRGEISFCIVPIDWPQEIESAFVINTSLYQGTRAIARYDRGKATHFHVLYKSIFHNEIINFVKHRYGLPTANWKRTIAPFGKPRQPNPTLVWRSHNINKNEVTILEIRKFDDSRTVFPDTKHGAIRLYIAGGPPVFPVVTAHDIMSIDWAARSDHLDDGFPTLAKTIRMQP